MFMYRIEGTAANVEAWELWGDKLPPPALDEYRWPNHEAKHRWFRWTDGWIEPDEWFKQHPEVTYVFDPTSKGGERV